MLFYPNYAINVKLCLNAYKESNKVYLAKKPSFFKRLFKKFEKARIVISQGKTSIDDKILDVAKMVNVIDKDLDKDTIAQCDCVLIALYPKATIEY